MLETYLSQGLYRRLYGEATPLGRELSISLRYEAPSSEGDGGLVVVLNADPDRLVDLISAALEVFAAPRMDESLFATAKAAVETRFRTTRVANREIPETVLQWFQDGLSADPRLEIWGRLAATDAAAIAEVLHTVQGIPPIIVVTAELARVDRERLAKLGAVQALTRADLTGTGSRPTRRP